MVKYYGIDENILRIIEQEYCSESALEILIGDGSKAGREELNAGIINANANPWEVAYAFHRAGLGPGKLLKDLGVGYGLPLVIGRNLGARVRGCEIVAANAQVAWQKFDALQKKGVIIPSRDAIDVGKDIEDYDIKDADVVFAYAVAQKQRSEISQSDIVLKFYNWAKSTAKLVIYRPGVECYQTVLKYALRAPFEGSPEHPFMIINRN